MIVHVVLFRPKPAVSERDREAMFAALTIASTEIPSVRRFRIGTRITHGASYEPLMTDDYPYSAIVEFDDLTGLQAYQRHPQHEELGRLYYALSDAALVYDYEMGSVIDRGEPHRQ